MNILALSNDGWNVCGFYLGFLEFVHGLAKLDNASLFMESGATERKKKALPGEVRFTVPYFLRSPAQLHLFASFLSFFRYLRRCWASVRDTNIVVANSEVSSISLGLIAKWLLRARLAVVVWEIDDITKKPLFHRVSYYYAMYSLYRFSDLVLVPSTFTLRAVKRLVPHKRVECVGAIVKEPPADVSLVKNPRLLCVIGVVDQKKHPELAVEVVRRVRELTGSDIQLVWIGDGSLRKNFTTHRFARFVGDVADEEKWSTLAQSSAYLMCSESEGFNLTVGEALNCGTPAVAFDLPVYHEIYKDAVVLVRWGDTEAMAREVIRVLSSPELRTELADRGKLIMKDYKQAEVIHRIRKTLCDILDIGSQ
jgi:glycosyltransferase involved in cell wall biosynthesis